MKVFAFGQEAVGLIAIGQMATGVLAIGQMATGVVAVGQLARGVIAIGQVGFGGVYGLGMLGVAPGYSVGLVSIGGLAKGLLPLSVLPRRKAPANAPSALPVPVPSDAIGTAEHPRGWIDVRLARTSDNEVAVLEGERRLRVTFDPQQQAAALWCLASGQPHALLNVEAADELVGEVADYRAAPHTERVLRCTSVQARPKPPRTGASPLELALRSALFAALLLAWWFVVGAPLLAALTGAE